MKSRSNGNVVLSVLFRNQKSLVVNDFIESENENENENESNQLVPLPSDIVQKTFIIFHFSRMTFKKNVLRQGVSVRDKTN